MRLPYLGGMSEPVNGSQIEYCTIKVNVDELFLEFSQGEKRFSRLRYVKRGSTLRFQVEAGSSSSLLEGLTLFINYPIHSSTPFERSKYYPLKPYGYPPFIFNMFPLFDD